MDKRNDAPKMIVVRCPYLKGKDSLVPTLESGEAWANKTATKGVYRCIRCGSTNHPRA